MDLEPCDAERHHYVGHGVGLGEQVVDLFTGADIPLGHPGRLHLVLRALRQAPALSHRLHDLEGPLCRIHAAGDQKQHDVVAAANGLVRPWGARVPPRGPGRCPATRRCRGRSRRQPHQDIKLVRLGILQACPRIKLVLNSGIATAAGGTQDGVVHKARALQRTGKMDMVSLSSRGVSVRAFTPVRSSSMRIMVGSSCPSMSSFSRLLSME